MFNSHVLVPISKIFSRAFRVALILMIATALFACERDQREVSQSAAFVDPARQQAELRAEDAYYRLPPPGIDKTAAYLTIYNQGTEDLALIGVTSSRVRKLELHEIIDTNGRMGMRRRDSILVPAGASVALKPGGLHMMLFGIASEAAEEMQALPVELEFVQAGAAIDGRVAAGELNRVQIVKKRLPVSLQPFDMRN